MVHYFKLDNLIGILHELNKQSKKVQLILIGDPFQLPPVVTQNMKNEYSKKEKRGLTDEDFYFHCSEKFQKLFVDGVWKCFFMKKNHRQSEEMLITSLYNIATGCPEEKNLKYFNQKLLDSDDDSPVQIGTVITPTLDIVHFYNELGLMHYHCRFQHIPIFEEKLSEYDEIENSYKGIDDPVNFANEAPIIFTQNDDQKRWANGTSGVIKDCLMSNSSDIMVIVDVSGKEQKIIPTRHYLHRLVYNDKTNTINNECVAIIKKLPFVLGFALTVHRCQGMNLEKMTFNPGKGCFVPGQLYVALSRVRKIDDLYLNNPISEKDIIVSSRTKSYFDDYLSKCEDVW
ncbi:hypothetical protein AGMMS50267_14200 [Spirochaetia bacterium]|nr:hypothetical protein AGMMS50267_14200 [Spirochaetia bacterium]